MLQQRCMTPQRDQYDVTRLIEESFNFAKTCLTGDSEQYIEELKYHMFAENISDLKLDEDKKIGYTFKCMGAGFWALKQADFRTALETIVFEGGDADTNGAVAGALLACKLGLHGLPDKWLKNLLHKSWLDGIIDRFIGLVMSHSPDSDTELRS